MEIAPQLRHNENIFAFYNIFGNLLPNCVPNFIFIIIQKCCIEMPIPTINCIFNCLLYITTKCLKKKNIFLYFFFLFSKFRYFYFISSQPESWNLVTIIQFYCWNHFLPVLTIRNEKKIYNEINE